MKWIVIDEGPQLGKTKQWRVSTADRAATLGVIKFFPRWRKYSFWPNANTLYEADCLRDIADFCEGQTKLWRAGLRANSGLDDGNRP